MQLSDAEILEFSQEALDLLDQAESALLEVNKGASLAGHYDAIFRVFHSVKGAASVINMTVLQSHMHELETFFTTLKGHETLDQAQMDRLLAGCDKAREILGVSNENSEAAPAATNSAASGDSALMEYLAETRENLQRLNECLSKIETGGINAELIGALYRDIHTIKGSSLLFGYADIGNFSHTIESHLESYRATLTNIPSATIDHLYVAFDLMEKMVEGIAKGESFSAADQVAELTRLFVEPGAQPLAKTEPVAPVAIVPPTAVAKTDDPDNKTDSPTSLRISVGILDRLMTLIGEMVLVRNQVTQYSNRDDDLEFINLSQRLDVVTSEMQAEVMKTRMQPIGSVLAKFQRVVRDLARDLSKKMDISFVGNETELDKALLEAVKDPLMHIVRNACDHGLEGPEERLKAGKPEKGHVQVRSFHEGGQVIIEVSDDGRGLNREALTKKAIERGLVSAEKAAQMQDKEIFAFIFAAGFSTAKAVTNVSGRGVGMDVVKRNIERIGGLVDILSTLGKGTTIRLKIPLTLAIVPAMIVRSDNGRYAVPQVKLLELVRVEKSKTSPQIEFIQGTPVFRLRGNLLPIIDLGETLGRKPDHHLRTQDDLPEVVNIVVVDGDSQIFGLIVDEVLDTADIVVKPLNKLIKSLSVFSGATVLGDGSISLILDILGIAQRRKLSLDHVDAHSTTKDLGAERLNNANREACEFLLVKVWGQGKHAIPLSLVSRMEEFSVSSIERSGGVPVVRYRDAILPILHLGSALRYVTAPSYENVEKIPVIVARFGSQLIGLEVEEILDVISSDQIIDDSFSDRETILGNLVHCGEVIVVINAHVLMEASGIFRKESKLVSAKGGKILFAEDTDFFRRHVSRALVAGGYEVLTAENGQQALSILRSTPDPSAEFCMVLSDIEMPEMNGLTLAREIRADKKLAGLPLVALTTRFDESSVKDGMAAGFDSYLEKLNAMTLIAEIEKVLKSNRERKAA